MRLNRIRLNRLRIRVIDSFILAVLNAVEILVVPNRYVAKIMKVLSVYDNCLWGIGGYVGEVREEMKF